MRSPLRRPATPSRSPRPPTKRNLSIPYNLRLNGAKPGDHNRRRHKQRQCLYGRRRHQSYAIESHYRKRCRLFGRRWRRQCRHAYCQQQRFLLEYGAQVGGAILNTGMASISKTSFFGNSPYFFGHSASCGAIDNRGPMTITTSTFDTNYANNNTTAGGAICNGATLTSRIARSATISHKETTRATAAGFTTMRVPSTLRTVPLARTLPRRAEEPSTAMGGPSRSAIRLLARTQRTSAAAGLSATRAARFLHPDGVSSRTAGTAGTVPARSRPRATT